MRMNKKEWMTIGFIFMLAVLFYSFTAFKMGNIVFYPSDESRFLELAKSLHFSGNVSAQYMIKNYDDILYPLLLSIGYFWYHPETILEIFRCIGVILMTSVVFHTFFLAKRMKIGNIFHMDGAVFITILSVLIPEMTYTSYLSAEVLLYPLFMWLLYCIYIEFSEEQKISKFNCLSVFLLFLAYMTKTFAIIFAAVYCMVLLLYGMMQRNKKIMIKAVASGSVFLFLVALLKAALFVINGMEYGTSHYDSVISIFPFDFQVFIGLVRGLLFYFGWFMLFTGIVPLLTICCNLKIFAKKDLLWSLYLLGCIIFSILEIVVIIHYAEEGVAPEVSRFHYRYLFYFFIPMLLVMMKYKRIADKKTAYFMAGFEIIALNTFFAMTNKNGQGICDGILCYFSRKTNVYQGGTDTLYAVLLILLIIIIIAIASNKDDRIIQITFAGMAVMFLSILPFSVRLPIENSSKTEIYIQDYINMAEYVNENGQNVYCVFTGDMDDPILRAAAYHKKDFKEADVNENVKGIEIHNDDTVICVSDNFPYELEGNMEEISADTQRIRIYEADKGTVSVNRNAYNINFTSYGFLSDGYDEAGKRYLLENGISYGPYIDLPSGKYQVEVAGENLLESQMLSYSGDELFPQEVVSASEKQMIWEIELQNDVSAFEFSVRNDNQEPVVLDYIHIKKIN